MLTLDQCNIIDRSEVTAPSFFYQLTNWVPFRSEIEFAIQQLDSHDAPWAVRERPDGWVAVFVPGKKEFDAGEGCES